MFSVLNEQLAPPSLGLVLAAGGFAVAVSAATFALMLAGPARWRSLSRANVLSTVVHEGGHALLSIVTGGGVFQIEVTSAETGLAHTWSTSRWSRVLTLAAGYATPPLAGLGAAALLHRGLAPAVLALTVLAMALVLLATRDLLTLAIVVTLGAAAFATLKWAPGWLQNTVAYLEAWLLLTSELGGVAALVVARVRHGYYSLEDDAAGLAEASGIPAFAWILGWAALIGWTAWTAVPMLWPDA
ncbi:M50 family metallopeptidase [Amycolatopsis sp. DR6-1]|uniref:M50 family metallopeptidase n=1 Tax=Amycolatopsis dendrobii TaxID=2760662 RepID=A0A7W3VS31_9PSEU|nr:M50 family metallopeptidase [Amycolatopsis dendrobii]